MRLAKGTARAILFSLTFLVVSAAHGGSPAASAEQVADPLPSEARRLRDEGRLEEAVAAFERFLVAHPESWQARYELALIHMSRNDLDQAELHLQKTILIAPRQAAPWARLGQVSLLKSDVATAERALVKARDLDPTDPGVRYNLGRIYERQGRDPEALAEYQGFLAAAPSDSKALGVRRRVVAYFEATDRREDAIEQYRILIATDPAKPEFHRKLADMLYRQLRYDEAAIEYRRVLELNPQSPGAHTALGFIARTQRKLDEAEVEYEAAHRQDPNAADPLQNLGEVRLEKGNVVGAIECFEKVIALNPDHPEAQYTYSRALIKAGRTELATHQRLAKQARERVGVPSSMGDTVRPEP
jgi:tetratricopeptide (TPR) repeat protein